MSEIKTFIHETDVNGSVTEARVKTKNYFYLNSTPDEKSFAIPTDDGVTAKYAYLIPSPGSQYSFTDDTNSGTDSLDDANGGGAIGTQVYVTQPTIIKLTEGSTYLHFKVIGPGPDRYLNVEFYS